ncbi:Pyrrolidone-carboxylate peptidase [Botrimarina colliarenosi]|uniref:Pyrrolidone-carboxylate peptidase n=1 Tax=Botrimarina colliarenosi TaxID=2528001 RepID=A0A5C6A9M4_9BACT|nr:pyroglutamyl-peptidase I [Botrimarina colliarenosi]TWT96018.1 Pyrrolidone-carboxylate peptidase [Botrimarina colliarenosi]
MLRILLTAFRPFDDWDQNASWLALQALTRDLPPQLSEAVEITTRLYPVDYKELRPRLAMDLQASYDVVLLIGQAAGSAAVRLEQFALNACRQRGDTPETVRSLEAEGPPAYRSDLPLGDWTRRLRECGVPTELSLHAGDYLCNAAMYWSHYLLESAGRRPLVAFVHLPLDVSQTARLERPLPSLPSEISAHALRLLVTWAAETVSPSAAIVSAIPAKRGEA